EVWALNKDACSPISDELFELVELDLAALIPIASKRHRHIAVVKISVDHLAIFRMYRAGNHGFVASRDAHGHQNGFCRARAAVVHGSVGNFHTGELADHRLELED